MNYYSHHIGDYAVETRHLSMIEHGAYRMLLDMYYSAEAPLPLDTKIVARKAGARTAEEISVVDTMLNEFFIVTPQGWIHARCDDEISVYQANQAEEQAKEAHEKERMRRYRERRAEMFAALRSVGVIPAWNIPMGDLQRLYDERCTCNAPETDLQRTCNAAVSAPATADPITKNQEPVTNNQEEESATYPQATYPQAKHAAEVLLLVEKNNFLDTDPKHPRLRELLERGATVQDFAHAVPIAKAAGKGFAYLLGVVDGKMSDDIARQTRPKNRDSPAVHSVHDPDSRASIEDLGIAQGLGRWNDITEHWSAYKARVLGRSEPLPAPTSKCF